MAGTIYCLPNLIADGTLEAATPPAVRTRAADIRLFFVEAAKNARAYLKLLGHPGPISELRIEEIGHDPAPALIDRWLEPVLAGEDAAIVSESGCPGIADPGAQIVARAQELGLRVMPWGGPSSILMTLMASGLDGQRFRFLGYLPVHADERAAALKDLETQSRRSETQLFIETPYRNGAMLESLVSTLAPDTRVTVATDVTGEHESIRTMTVRAWAALMPEERALPKLPTVFALLAAPRGTAPRYAPPAARAAGTQAAPPQAGTSDQLRKRDEDDERERDPRRSSAVLPRPHHDGRGVPARASRRPCDVARRQTQAGKAQHRPLEDRRRPSRRRRPRDEGRSEALAPRPARG